MFIDLITIGAFAVLSLIVFLVGDAIAGGRRVAKNAASLNRIPNLDPSNETSSAIKPLSSFTQSLAAVIPQATVELEGIERDLKRAGYYRSTALIEYLATRNFLIVTILICTGILAVLADPNSIFPKLIFLVGIFSSICGYAVSRFVLANQASKRVARIQKGLPDALDIIMMCITGGLPLGKALERVSKQIEFSHRDLAIEFEIIRRHADADTMANALRHFADRVDAPDVNALAALVTQTQRMGTHVATAICEYADSVRRAHRQRAEEHASKTSIKMLFPIILCLAPPIYILLLGPPLLRLSNFIKEEHRPGGILAPNVPGLEGIYEQDREEAAE